MAGRKIKVMHVLDSLSVGGMERMLINMVNGTDAGRFEHLICCVSRLGDAAGLLRPEVRCFDMGKGVARDLLMPRKIAQLMRAERPDVVHTRNWSGVDGVIAQKLTKLSLHRSRLVHSEHGRNLPYIHFEPFKSRVARRAIYHLADVVFAVSAELRDHYCRETGFSPRRMRVVPNGVNVARFDEADPKGVREELGIAADDFVIGMVSRLNPTKDLLTLARAFAEVYRTRSDQKLRLVIVGEGEERAKLESFAAGSGLEHAIILTGTRHDVPRLLRAMDAFALSSLSEGLSGAILEAMCAGLPVVATRVGANPELVTEGETGFLVEPRDGAAMAERLARLIADPEMARRFGAAGRRRVEQHYSLDAMVRRYEELYESLAAAPA
ncbi:MAG TPA: glycosyltransferase [Blastocatellia bacterium]|nr:glycosyltransferase [Blastocatellia bacterium]